MFFSALLRGSISSCPQPRHFRRKSAPVRSTRHVLDPQGCAFFIVKISFNRISIVSPLDLVPIVLGGLFDLIRPIVIVGRADQIIRQILLPDPVVREIVRIEIALLALLSG